jgi:hypothetical protein
MRSGAIDKLMFFASVRQMRRVEVSLLPEVLGQLQKVVETNLLEA